MLARALVAFLLVSTPLTAAANVVIHATCAAGVASEAAHAQRLRTTLARALAGMPGANRFTLDVALVRLDTASVASGVEVRAEVRGVLSEQGRIRFTSISSARAAGPSRDLTLIERDAIEGAAQGLAIKLRRQATAR